MNIHKNARLTPRGREGLLPLVGMDERVELQEVDVVGAQPLERSPDLRLSALEIPLVGLVARKKAARCRSIHRPIRSSASP
jgi:hypothetical protein